MAKCWGNSVCEKNLVKLLGITIDNELKFDDHITKICHKANSKLSALSLGARYLSMEQKSLNKPSPGNFFDSLFTSKPRQDPLQNDLLVPCVKTDQR